MPPTLHAGAQLERAPGQKYLATLQFAELAPKPPLPRPATLASWRARMPEGFRASIVAPRPAIVSEDGPMRFDEALRAGLSWLREAADAVDAAFIVVPTEAQLTTGQRDRDLMSAYFERIGNGRPLVWAPAGLWEPELAHPFAQKLGVLRAIDPLEEEGPLGATGYARLRAMGGRSRLTDGILVEVSERLLSSVSEDVYVAIESPRSFQDAVRLHQLTVAEDPAV